MWKLRLLQLVAITVLAIGALGNLSFGMGVCSSFVSGGPQAVRNWITHIETEGRLQMKEVSPGVVQVTFPKYAHPYRRFFMGWLGIATATTAAFLAERFCSQRIRLHGQQPSHISA